MTRKISKFKLKLLTLLFFVATFNYVNSQGLFSLSGNNKEPNRGGVNANRNPNNNFNNIPNRPVATQPPRTLAPSTTARTNAPSTIRNFGNPGNPMAGVNRAPPINPTSPSNIGGPIGNLGGFNSNNALANLRGELPPPLNLQKINATDTQMTLRFRIPDFDDSVFTGYVVLLSIYGSDKRDKFQIDRDMVKPYTMGTGLLYGNVVVSDLSPGRVYEASIQTHAVRGGFEKTSPKVRGANLILARTLPRAPATLTVEPIDEQPNQVKVNIQTLSTVIDGSAFDTVILNWGELSANDQMINIQEKTFLHTPNNGISPIGENMEFEINNLEIGKQYRFQSYTLSSVADVSNVDIEQSAITKTDYTVGFIGPRLVEKTGATETTITLSFIGPTVPDVTHYQIEYYELLPIDGGEAIIQNITIQAQHDYTRIAPRTNFNFISDPNDPDSRDLPAIPEDILTESLPREIAILEDLVPGAVYSIEIRSVRMGKSEQSLSSPSTSIYRTLPGLPKNVRITKLFTKNVTIEFGRPDGQMSTYELDYEFLSKNERFPTKYYGNSVKAITLADLKPGGLYLVNITVYSKEGSVIDATRNTYTKILRTIPNAPVMATAASTMGTIHLRWQAPVDMEDVNDWQYKIVYGIARPRNEEDWEADTSIYKEGVKWVASADGAPTREDFLMKLKSGRIYEIRLYTAAGKSSDPIETIKFSAVLGPLKVLTQPEQPKFTKTYQLTTRHIKIAWQRPRTPGGRFTGYILNVNRRPESRATVDYKPESYEYQINADKTSFVIEVTPGAIYNMTLTTTSGVGNSTLRSIITSDNKRSQVRVWSPYETHLPFARLSWKFEDCDNIGRLGPSQAQCDIRYSTTNLGQVGPMVDLENGIQKWRAPMRGLYRITARGAGYGTDFGGLGATVSGLFHLDEGSALNIVVGQRGYSSGSLVAGGGGASYVLTEKLKPLVVAGGAGGNDPRMNKMSNMSIANARLWQGGNDASEVGIKFGRGGIAGNGGERGALGSGGGAGAYVDGDDPSAVGGRDKVKPSRSVFDKPGMYVLREEFIAQGGRYTEITKTPAGNEYISFSEGGFGGGGAGFLQSAGGGGGYSGGAGGPKNGTSGGGGCFLKYTGGTQLATIDNAEKGQVIITLIGLPNEEPIPMTWYLVLSFICGIGLAALCGCLLAWVARCMDFLIPTEEIEEKRQRLILQQAAVDAAKRKIQYEATLKEAQQMALRKKAEQEQLDRARREREDGENPYYTENTNHGEEEYEALSEVNRRKRARAREAGLVHIDGMHPDETYVMDQSYHTNLSVNSQEASDIRALGKNFDRSPAPSEEPLSSLVDGEVVNYYQQKPPKRAPSMLSSIGSFIYGTGKRVRAQTEKSSMRYSENGAVKLNSVAGKWREKPKEKKRSAIKWVKPVAKPKPGKWTKPEDLNAPRRALSSIPSTSIPSIRDLIDHNFRVREFGLGGEDNHAYGYDREETIQQFNHIPGYNKSMHKGHHTTPGKGKPKKFAIPSEITHYNPNEVVKATVPKEGTPDSIKALRQQVRTGERVTFGQKLQMFAQSNIMAPYLKKQQQFQPKKQFKHQVLLPGEKRNPHAEVINASTPGHEREELERELVSKPGFGKNMPGGVALPGMTDQQNEVRKQMAAIGGMVANLAARDQAPDVVRASDMPQVNDEDVFLQLSNTKGAQPIVEYEDDDLPEPDLMNSHLPKFKEVGVKPKTQVKATGKETVNQGEGKMLTGADRGAEALEIVKAAKEAEEKLREEVRAKRAAEAVAAALSGSKDALPSNIDSQKSATEEPPPLPSAAPVPERNTKERAKIFGGIKGKVAMLEGKSKTIEKSESAVSTNLDDHVDDKELGSESSLSTVSSDSEDQVKTKQIEKELENSGIKDPVLRKMFRDNSIKKSPSRSSSPVRRMSIKGGIRTSSNERSSRPTSSNDNRSGLMYYNKTEDRDRDSLSDFVGRNQGSRIEDSRDDMNSSQITSNRRNQTAGNSNSRSQPEIPDEDPIRLHSEREDRSEERSGPGKSNLKSTPSFSERLQMFAEIEKAASRATSRAPSPKALSRQNSTGRIPNMSELSGLDWTGPGNCPPAPGGLSSSSDSSETDFNNGRLNHPTSNLAKELSEANGSPNLARSNSLRNSRGNSSNSPSRSPVRSTRNDYGNDDQRRPISSSYHSSPERSVSPEKSSRSRDRPRDRGPDQRSRDREEWRERDRSREKSNTSSSPQSKSHSRGRNTSPKRHSYREERSIEPNYEEEEDPVYENKEAVEARKIAQSLIDNNIGLNIRDRHEYGRNLVDDAITEEEEEASRQGSLQGHRSRQPSKLASIGENSFDKSERRSETHERTHPHTGTHTKGSFSQRQSQKSIREEELREDLTDDDNHDQEYYQWQQRREQEMNRQTSPEMSEEYNPNFVRTESQSSSSSPLEVQSGQNRDRSRSKGKISNQSKSNQSSPRRSERSERRKQLSDSENEGTVKEKSPYSDEDLSDRKNGNRYYNNNPSHSRSKTGTGYTGTGYDSYTNSRTSGSAYTSEREKRSRPATIDSEDVYSDGSKSYHDDRTVITHSSEEDSRYK